MTKNDEQKEFVGCGGNCACAQMSDEKEVCVIPVGGVKFDSEGKCPCGKSKDDCCHADAEDTNEALHELCEPHNGKHVCDVNSDLQKTGI